MKLNLYRVPLGTDRMLEALNAVPDAVPEQLLEHVPKAADGSVGNAEQFDDLTVLCLKYNANKEGASV